MQHGENDFDGALFRGGMPVDRNAAAVIDNRDRRSVGVQRDRDVLRIAVHRFVDGVVQDFPDEVVESGRSHPPDEHARTLADGLQPLENGDVFRGVVRGCHVYNVRLLRRVLLAFLATTIVAAFDAHVAAAVAVSEDVPVPGGTAAFAQALGFDAPPDRARFVAELARLVYTTPEGRSAAVDALLLRLKQTRNADDAPASVADADLVPVPLTSAVRSDAAFH